MSKELNNLVIERVNKSCCPVCNEIIDEEEGIVFEAHNGTKQPIHKRHVKYGIPDGE